MPSSRRDQRPFSMRIAASAEQANSVAPEAKAIAIDRRVGDMAQGSVRRAVRRTQASTTRHTTRLAAHAYGTCSMWRSVGT